jgi:hypothetical protein
MLYVVCTIRTHLWARSSCLTGVWVELVLQPELTKWHVDESPGPSWRGHIPNAGAAQQRSICPVRYFSGAIVEPTATRQVFWSIPCHYGYSAVIAALGRRTSVRDQTALARADGRSE